LSGRKASRERAGAPSEDATQSVVPLGASASSSSLESGPPREAEAFLGVSKSAPTLEHAPADEPLEELLELPALLPVEPVEADRSSDLAVRLVLCGCGLALGCAIGTCPSVAEEQQWCIRPVLSERTPAPLSRAHPTPLSWPWLTMLVLLVRWLVTGLVDARWFPTAAGSWTGWITTKELRSVVEVLLFFVWVAFDVTLLLTTMVLGSVLCGYSW
jgi:hypothetical protein